MTQPPFFSIVIPTRDRTETLAKTIVALIAQHVADFEAIIIDDGGIDAEAISALLDAVADPRFRVLRQQQAGPAAARNTGLADAKGRWIAFIDDDDHVDAEWLRALHDLASQPAVGIVCCGVRVVDSNGAEVERALPVPLGPAYLGETALFLAGAFAFRTDVAALAGGEDTEILYGENFEFGLRLVSACRTLQLGIATTSLAPVTYRANDRPMTLDGVQARLRSCERLIAKHETALRSDSRLRADTFSIAGVSAARLDQHRKALRYLWRAAVAQPLRLTGWARVVVELVPPLRARRWHTDEPRHDQELL